ncbi:hypothetical protein NECID01_1724 [Nematocida sp. AWRm77]|nr:hypothetical protein NECID01_1724 [Nematocida sp. AWRm77]
MDGERRREWAYSRRGRRDPRPDLYYRPYSGAEVSFPGRGRDRRRRWENTGYRRGGRPYYNERYAVHEEGRRLPQHPPQGNEEPFVNAQDTTPVHVEKEPVIEKESAIETVIEKEKEKEKDNSTAAVPDISPDVKRRKSSKSKSKSKSKSTEDEGGKEDGEEERNGMVDRISTASSSSILQASVTSSVEEQASVSEVAQMPEEILDTPTTLSVFETPAMPDTPDTLNVLDTPETPSVLETPAMPAVLETPASLELSPSSPEMRVQEEPAGTVEGRHGEEEGTGTGQARIPAVYAYISAKHRMEKEEEKRVQALNEQLESPCVFSIEEEIAYWEHCDKLKTIETEEESIRDIILLARQRSVSNQAAVPRILALQSTAYLNTTVIKDPESLHRRKNKLVPFIGEESLLKKGFAKTGKKFDLLRENFLPWRTPKELVLLYYHKKRALRLKSWQDAYKDTRKMTDADLKEVAECEWTHEEKEEFSQAYTLFGKKWHLYIEKLPNKTEGDLKVFYKYFKKFILKAKEVKPEGRKEDSKKKQKDAEPNVWKSHERQTFALLFPHIGKNWNTLANYIVTKNATEIRSYHRLYYKNLSPGEKILEIHLKDIGMPEIRTEPLYLPKQIEKVQQHSAVAGVLFSTNT